MLFAEMLLLYGLIDFEDEEGERMGISFRRKGEQHRYNGRTEAGEDVKAMRG
jgi:hypothetical protein